MHPEKKALRSRIALRVYGLFIVSATFPVIVLAIFSYIQLERQNDLTLDRQLHDTAKGYASALFERLDLAEAGLRALNELAKDRQALDGLFPILLQKRFRGVVLLDRNRVPVQQLGRPFALPDRLTSTLQHNRANPSLLLSGTSGQLPEDVFMATPLAGGVEGAQWVVALLNPEFLWGRGESDQRFAVCALDGQNQPLFCPTPDLDHLLRDLSRTPFSPAADASLATTEERRLLSRNLFLGARFQDANWRIVIATPLARFNDRFSGFDDFLVKVAALTLLVVALLSGYLIRKTFHPLAALMAGIRRITDNDFSSPVRIASHDELGAIASAFNHMVGRIQHQLHWITAFAAIDNAILARQKRRDIVSAILDGASSSIGCDFAALAIRDPKNDSFTVYERTGPAGNVSDRREMKLDQEMLAYLPPDGALQLSCNDRKFAELLAPPKKAGVQRFLVIPIQLQDRLEALFTLGFNAAHALEQDLIDQAEEFAQRVAVALADATREERLQYLAYHDALTDLPNRLLLKDRLEQALSLARREDEAVAIMFIDLDHFKSINDSLGHKAGDALLKDMASRLKRSVRKGDTVARLGGDEFVLVATNMRSEERTGFPAMPIADKILALAAEPFRIQDHEIRLTASIGIAVFPSDGEETDNLLKNADTAMYHAKQEGRNNYQFYSEELNSMALSRLDLGAAMHRALDAGEFRVFFQPKLDLKSQRINGVEALLRWAHPERGLLSPDAFIGLAEDTGQIIELGRWALRQACTQARSLQRSGTARDLKVSVSVNISPKQFAQSAVVDFVREALTSSGLAPSSLELEITEGAAMQNPRRTIKILKQLRDMGLTISIDDFGMGLSSLSYIKHFPLDVLKIDKSFVQNMEQDTTDYAIVKSTIVLAHSLNLMVVAEGVETLEQLEILSQLDCDQVQGFLFSPPVGEDRIAALLERGISAGSGGSQPTPSAGCAPE